jgi:hypothetical protein
MSYLLRPRIVFSGRFHADVPTVNNDPTHFETETFHASDVVRSDNKTNGWFNPGGSGSFRLTSPCKVTGLEYTDATPDPDPSPDPLYDAQLCEVPSRVAAKIVDLDTGQQSVPTIFGLQIGFQTSSGIGFVGDVDPLVTVDLWQRGGENIDDGSELSGACQGLLTNVRFEQWQSSKVLKQLYEISGDMLSVRLVLDAIRMRPGEDFLYGRVVGVIGQYVPGDPRTFVAGRRLRAVDKRVNDAPAIMYEDPVRRTVLAIDLGNSLPTKPGGKDGFRLDPLGPLTVATRKAGPIGLVTLDDGWYKRSGGIVEVSPLEAAGVPITITALRDPDALPAAAKSTELLAEADDGLWLRADQVVVRLDPGDHETVLLYARRFGELPSKPLDIRLWQDSSGLIPPTKNFLQGGTPWEALKFPSRVSVPTAARGVARVTLEADDPGRPRIYVDGQVYQVRYRIQGQQDKPPAIPRVLPGGTVIVNAGLRINVLIHSSQPARPVPTWLSDVGPIFQQYANLYPAMGPILRLDNYADVVAHRAAVRRVLALPITDPNHMPVTRDLSRAKRDMICRWLDHPHYMNLQSVDELHCALEAAIKLEFATIPPYLAALYSLKPGRNLAVASALRHVVREEMLHLALAANLLVSVGGQPDFLKPASIPSYPTTLPGGLRAGLAVGIAPCSIALIRDVFMEIERPEVVLEEVEGEANPGDPAIAAKFTIGWFYREIDRALVRLHETGELTFGNADRQLPAWPDSVSHAPIAITSLAEARRAIQTIRHQGEGRGERRPFEGDNGNLSHYFRFREIVEGRRLVPTGTGYEYLGDPIPFDEDGVYKMTVNPDASGWTGNAAKLGNQFVATYHSLLRALNDVWHGRPQQVSAALGVMASLKLLAHALLNSQPYAGQGPCFQQPDATPYAGATGPAAARELLMSKLGPGKA